MKLPHPFRLASCMAPNADAMCRALAQYLVTHLETPVELVDQAPWNERERMLDWGVIDLCWICGLQYVEKVDAGAGIGLSVTPVMKAMRYGNAPVYFSDIVVRSDSRHSTFADLQGAIWAYNEPRSHSGYNVVRYHLSTMGLTLDYFGALIEAGAHQASLRMVASGEVAAAAIDSTVLEAELRSNAALSRKLRAIETLGPSPAPPWVFSARVPQSLRIKVTRCLADMHRTRGGAAILDGWGIGELRVVDDRTYDPIRSMTRAARTTW